jgi:glyoxylase-like metal-dependent hydrolase (beta-lactamase superfamily II)
MSLLIQQIPNKPIDSNSYVVYKQETNACIIIDPGTEDSVDLIDFIKIKHLRPEYIFLTHEHFDHIWGVNKLRSIYKAKIVCSKICSLKIIDKKKNMSVFYNQIGFETFPADLIIEDINYQLIWNGENIKFIDVPGHTNASVCILIENNLFTGDTIIKNTKTVTKLPDGSKEKLIESFSLLENSLKNRKIKIYSGHGPSFYYNEINNYDLI